MSKMNNCFLSLATAISFSFIVGTLPSAFAMASKPLKATVPPIQNPTCTLWAQSKLTNAFAYDPTPLYQYAENALQKKGYQLKLLDSAGDRPTDATDSDFILVESDYLELMGTATDCYDFKNKDEDECEFEVQLIDGNGNVYAQAGGSGSGTDSSINNYAKKFNSGVEQQIDSFPACEVQKSGNSQ